MSDMRDNHRTGRAVFSISLRSIYGWQSIATASHPIVARLDRNNLQVALSARPFSNLIDLFPILLCLPKWLSKWKRTGAEWFSEQSDVFEDLLGEVRRNRAQVW